MKQKILHICSEATASLVPYAIPQKPYTNKKTIHMKQFPTALNTAFLLIFLACFRLNAQNGRTEEIPFSAESPAGTMESALHSSLSAADIPFKQSEWNGYKRFDFDFRGRESIVILPDKPSEGNPWIWRPAFFGHEPQADLALLAKGWHVVYHDLTHLYGSPGAVASGYEFYSFLTKSYRLNPKTVPEGFSRGGLFAFNWAAAYPDLTACIYVDAPVCDFKSWPAAGNPDHPSSLWKDCLNEYGFSKEEAWKYDRNPVDNVSRLKQAGIPVIAVCGEDDDVVPYKDNMGLIRQRYLALGGHVQVILKPGVKHHPHSLEDPGPIVDFITQQNDSYRRKMHLQQRGSLRNSKIKFEREKKGRVAFLGGSITEMKGWREIICEELQQRFPDTEFDFINAGISSTGTTPGAFRFERDILRNGPVDLLFEEAAVNDETNKFSDREQIRGMEGIVRQARMANPNTDLVMLHFIWDGMIRPLEQGIMPQVILNHEKVADYYRIPSINLALEVSQRMRDGEFDWTAFGGTHPAPSGHKLYAAAISRLLDEMWDLPLSPTDRINPHPLPETPLDTFSYFNGKLVDIREAKPEKGWRFEARWQPKIKAGTRKGFVDVPAMETLKAGAKLRLSFKGKAIGIFHAAGPDAGIIEYSIDGKPYRKKDPFTEWSGSLYIPWVTMLESELEEGDHEIIIRTAKEHHPASKGTSCRIFYFTVNE
ncbi:MAG: GDSL-type esterase/lipase family protein [Tannerella sp.]|jgi:pimeloyl-ACP methyl ester carboxylesterase|nr:GDSL-type esterase/lipase family protein [Tannerella sp.]